MQPAGVPHCLPCDKLPPVCTSTFARAHDLLQELRHQPILSVTQKVGRATIAAPAVLPLCASRITGMSKLPSRAPRQAASSLGRVAMRKKVIGSTELIEAGEAGEANPERSQIAQSAA